MVNRIICDTSIIIDRKISELIEKSKLKDIEVIIPTAVLDELQSQASKGREPGFIGLDELKSLRKTCESKGIKLRFVGVRPTLEEIKLAKAGRLDAIIRDVAKTEDGILYTADFVQALVAEAEGVKVQHIPADIKTKNLEFEKFFTDDTLSVHLKEGVAPLAKRGKPGKFELVKIADKLMEKEDVENIIKEISEATRISEEGHVEVSRAGATVIQFGNYRIAITRPPFSDGMEVTIVRPIVKMRLEDYRLSEKLMQRLKEKAAGIILAGPPGSGKSTLAASMAEFYLKQGKIVKAIESPRDLQVGPEITQYGALEGDFEKTAEILLLVRPDYSVFDEVKKTKDFATFADMRLSGVGMIGTVHASDPVDAIQRFITRMELGMIPHIIDTIIFVKDGEVKQIYNLSMVVKMPSGMTEADLSRPVVEVRDFETDKLEYEIYTYGEENMIVPVSEKGERVPAARKLAAERIMQDVRKFDPNAEVELVSDEKAVVRVENEVIPRIIGKEGSMINQIQDRLGIHIDVEPRIASMGKPVDFDTRESGNSIDFTFDRRLTGKNASIYVDNEFLFSATIGKKSAIKVSKESEVGKKLLSAFLGKKKINIIS